MASFPLWRCVCLLSVLFHLATGIAGAANYSWLDIYVTALNFPGGRTITLGNVGSFQTVAGQSSYHFNHVWAAEEGVQGYVQDASNPSNIGSLIVVPSCATNFACVHPLSLAIAFGGMNGTNQLQTATASVCINIYNATTNTHTYHVIRTDTGATVGNSVDVPAGTSVRFCQTFGDGPHDLQAIDEGGRVIAEVKADDGRYGISNGDSVTRLQGSDVNSVDGGGSKGSQAQSATDTNAPTSAQLSTLHEDNEDLQLMLAAWSNRNEILAAQFTNWLGKIATNGGSQSTNLWTNGLTWQQLRAELTNGFNQAYVPFGDAINQSNELTAAALPGMISIGQFTNLVSTNITRSEAVNPGAYVYTFPEKTELGHGSLSFDLNPLNWPLWKTIAAMVKKFLRWFVTAMCLAAALKILGDNWRSLQSVPQVRGSGQSFAGGNLALIGSKLSALAVAAALPIFGTLLIPVLTAHLNISSGLDFTMPVVGDDPGGVIAASIGWGFALLDSVFDWATAISQVLWLMVWRMSCASVLHLAARIGAGATVALMLSLTPLSTQAAWVTNELCYGIKTFDGDGNITIAVTNGNHYVWSMGADYEINWQDFTTATANGDRVCTMTTGAVIISGNPSYAGYVSGDYFTEIYWIADPATDDDLAQIRAFWLGFTTISSFGGFFWLMRTVGRFAPSASSGV